MTALCRDCLSTYEAGRRCPHCASLRTIEHPELFDLTIAHMDCDAFYAAVEKRDNPSLADKPVIIGGGKRGVVSTACYIARVNGVRSAMPMYKALKLCPNAVVIKPRMQAYIDASRAIRSFMQELTPVVQPLSLDEAFLDMSGTQRLHGAPPAVMLAKLVKRIQIELQLSGSIGLSYNKFLAKVASDFDKPHGFFVIGQAETTKFLHDKPVHLIWGVGSATQRSLNKAGIRTFSDLSRWDQQDLIARFGHIGDRLWHLARGQDSRRVSSNDPIKSISHETTFNHDITDIAVLDGHLWRLAQKVSDRAKSKQLAGHVITLKLKRSNHSTITRRITIQHATQMTDTIYQNARILLDQFNTNEPFRLIGCGLSHLCLDDQADVAEDLFDPHTKQRQKTERATDVIRKKFGSHAITKGRTLR